MHYNNVIQTVVELNR
jgi:hypothetical protein